MIKIELYNREIYQNFILEKFSFISLFRDIKKVEIENIGVYPGIVDDAENLYFLIKHPEFVDVFKNQQGV